MTIKQSIEDYLATEPKFRERKNKDRGIVNLLIKRYHSLGQIDKDTLIAAVQDYNSMDRAWRKTLEENPDLRGKDYGDKDELERRRMEDLGYNVGGGEAEADNPQKTLL